MVDRIAIGAQHAIGVGVEDRHQQEGGFVGFDEAVQAGRLEARRKSEKPVAPAEGGIFVHTVAARRVAVDQCPGLLAPTLAMPQPRQRRPAERIERPATDAVAEPRQAVGFAPAPAGSVMAARAGRGSIEDTRESVAWLPLSAKDLDCAPTLTEGQIVDARNPLAEGFDSHAGMLHARPFLSFQPNSSKDFKYKTDHLKAVVSTLLPTMKLTLASQKFEEQQAIFTAEIVGRIRIKLQEAGVEQEKLEDLTASIALSIAGVIDDLAGLEVDGLEVHPYLTFRTDEDELIHCGENAYTYEHVYGAMKKLFHA